MSALKDRDGFDQKWSIKLGTVQYCPTPKRTRSPDILLIIEVRTMVGRRFTHIAGATSGIAEIIWIFGYASTTGTDAASFARGVE